MDDRRDDELPFSEREGIVPRKTIQLRSMDDALRTAIWNILSRLFWADLPYYMGEPNNPQKANQVKSRLVFEYVWMNVFDKPIDDIPRERERALPTLKNIYFGLPWYKVYDLVEYIGQRNASLINQGSTTRYAILCYNVMHPRIVSFQTR